MLKPLFVFSQLKFKSWFQPRFILWEIWFSKLRKRIESVSFWKKNVFQRQFWLDTRDTYLFSLSHRASSPVTPSAAMLALCPSSLCSFLLPISHFTAEPIQPEQCRNDHHARHSFSSPAGSDPGSCLQFSLRLCLGDLHYGSLEKEEKKNNTLTAWFYFFFSLFLFPTTFKC